MDIINERKKQLEDKIAFCFKELNDINTNNKEYMLSLRRLYVRENYKDKLQRSLGRSKSKIKHNHKLFNDIKPKIDEFDDITGIKDLLTVYDEKFDFNAWKL